MPIIAIKNIPCKWGLVDVVKAVAKMISGPFEPLNFGDTKYGKKTCYLQISERLDPLQIVARISNSNIKGQRYVAYVPDYVPNIQVSDKRKRLPFKLRNALNIPELELPHEVITFTLHEVYQELQYKYPGLYNLSGKTGHKLLDELARILGERLTEIMETNNETRDSCFQLSRWYRKTHPHFGDFQLILSTLHKLQDASGAPRAQIQESDLADFKTNTCTIEKVPLARVKKACFRYSDRIDQLLKVHIKSLDSEITPNDNEALIARKRVREQLKRMASSLPLVVRQVVANHFIPDDPPHRRVRIYGTPFLPARDLMAPFTAPFTAAGARVVRSTRMYNLLMFKVPYAQYAALQALDSTVISGAKLTIRSSDAPIRDVTDALRSELAAHFGGTPADMPYDEDEDGEEGGQQE